MRRRLVLAWLACGLLPLVVLWAVLLARPPERAAERAAARAVAEQLDGFVAAHAAVVAELAERFSQWETLPAPALLDALRTAATRHLALRQLVVADSAGRLLAGFDSDRPPGREGLPAGSLDGVLSHREALRGAGVLVTTRARAGAVTRLELAAPIRRADGTRQGYVGASLSLRQTRKRLRAQAASGLILRVTDAQGALVFPCRGQPPRGGATLRTGRFSVTVARRRAGLPWAAVGASALTVALLLAGLGLLRVLDRRR
jgi:hypothetical protein